MNFWNSIKPPLGWNNALAALVFAGAFAASLFFQGTTSILFVPALVGMIFYGVVIWRPFSGTDRHIPRSATALLLSLFWLYMAVSLFWSTVPYISMLFFFIISSFPFVFFILVSAPDPYKAALTAGGVALTVLAGIAVWAVIQFFFLYDVYGPRIHHPMLNPNNLAAVFNMAFFTALGLYLLAQGRAYIAATFFLVVLFFLALLVTQSRGALLIVILVLPVFLLLLRSSSVFVLGKSVMFLPVAFVCAVLVHMLGYGKLGKYMAGLPYMGGSHSVVDRLSLWDSTWHMLLDHPWIGTGLATFSYYYGGYRDLHDMSDGYFAHMDPLQFGAEMGFAAPLLFYAFLLAVLVRTVMALRRDRCRSDAFLKARIAVPFLALTTLILHTHISFHLYMSAVLIPAACLLAYWYLATEEALGARRFVIGQLKARRRLDVILILLFTLSAVWIMRAGASTYFANKAQEYMGRQQIAEGNAAIDSLCRYAPSNIHYCLEYRAKSLIERLARERARLSPEEKKKLYEEALGYLNAEEKMASALFHIWNIRAQLYFLAQGDIIPDGYARAEVDLKRVLVVNPLFIDGRIGLANIYKQQGNPQKALALLEDGLRWPWRRSPVMVHYLMDAANLRKQLGDEATYQMYFLRAKTLADQLNRQGAK
ncbi:MAG: O-antigen ligase family protein [Rhodospirillales bacterium]|nr:O-antigen ligase family protein [Rhodospirillales bacterium]